MTEDWRDFALRRERDREPNQDLCAQCDVELDAEAGYRLVSEEPS